MLGPLRTFREEERTVATPHKAGTEPPIGVNSTGGRERIGVGVGKSGTTGVGVAGVGVAGVGVAGVGVAGVGVAGVGVAGVG
ncbi:MAG: hypothetical protein QXS68_03180, partial [Candidatus Methanomethylicaceae archaeon]